jgi:hypothetical protein
MREMSFVFQNGTTLGAAVDYCESGENRSSEVYDQSMNRKSAEFADFICADRFVLRDQMIQEDPAEDDDEEDADEDEDEEDEQDDDSDGYSE